MNKLKSLTHIIFNASDLNAMRSAELLHLPGKAEKSLQAYGCEKKFRKQVKS